MHQGAGHYVAHHPTKKNIKGGPKVKEVNQGQRSYHRTHA